MGTPADEMIDTKSYPADVVASELIRIPAPYAYRLRVISAYRRKTGRRTSMVDLFVEYAGASIDAEYRRAVLDEAAEFETGDQP